MKPFFLGLDCYEAADYPRLLHEPAVRGLVVGDLFCEKRMFENGRLGLLEAIDAIAAAGKAIVFQCPVYVTSRNYEDVRFLLQYIRQKHTKTYVIVHDLGMVHLISQEFSEYVLLWGRMARFREYVLNRDFLQFLKSNGVTGIELTGGRFRSLAEQCGLTPYIVFGWGGYATIGRQCYNQYQGLGCCREDCLNGRYSMHDTESSFQMKINGYMMGESFSATGEKMLAEEDTAEQIVYRKTIAEYDRLKEDANGSDL